MTRWLLLAVVLVWLAFGLAWAALHWVIVPRIGEFRPQLEARATQALGIKVRIGAVTAQSNGPVPTVEMTDVALVDAQGRVGLSLPRVLVALSIRSLWRLGFEQMTVDRPELDVRRSADGRISVGGFDLAGLDASGPETLDWIFAQTEIAVHDGTVRWTDEQRGTAPLPLQRVDLVVRNVGRHHDLRLDATPPASWGERFSLRGRFLQPLLSHQRGRWQDWDGQLYAAFERVDLSELRRYADLGVELSQGKGAVRAWADVDRAQLTSVQADVALSEVVLTLGPKLAPLSLQQVRGRLATRFLAGGFEFSTQALAFETPDGLRWPGGNVRVLSVGGDGGAGARGELQADQLDLATLGQIANRLPMDSGLREQLARYAPKGRVETLTANWRGPLGAPVTYAVKGRVSQLQVTSVADMPGVDGLNADFDFSQQTGRVALSLTKGTLDLPTVFQERLLPLDQLTAQATWQVVGDRVTVQVKDARFSNADAQGEAKFKWQTGDVLKSASHSRFPGTLDLQASLSRADGLRVWRYLPLGIDPAARQYVREAVLDGQASNVRFVVKGDVADIPASTPKQGEFRISADVRNARLAYVPRSLQPQGELPWPVLSDISGELLIDGLQLRVRNAKGRIGDSGGLQVVRAQALIADLMHTQVNVDASVRGGLPEVLRLIRGSPIDRLTGHALARSVLTGTAECSLKLLLPVADLDKSTVQGSVLLEGNEVQITPETPRLTRVRGGVNFTQTGFSLSAVQARLLGGDARIDGGLQFVATDARARGAPSVLRINGTASAEGLRQATELGRLARLASRASGSAAYSATLGWRRDTPELQVSSNLQGMGLNFPAPLKKEPQEVLPMRFQNVLMGDGSVAASPQQDRFALTLERLVSVAYERDVSASEPKVLRGLIAVGGAMQEGLTLPQQGVRANIVLPKISVDAWADVLSGVAGASIAGGDGASASSLQAYLPSTLAVRSDALTFSNRQFNHVVIGGSRDASLWRANVDADELNGYLEYRQPGAAAPTGEGRVYARLARLSITPAVANEVEGLLDVPPASIPALDIAVDDFQLGSKRLGRLDVEAVNRTSDEENVREWRLNKFNVSVPEATLTATGNWARLGAQGGGAVERRRTVMNFKLAIADGGALLARFGMKDVVRQASGTMEGQMSWLGSPLKLDYPTLGGAFTVNVAAGQFLKADPGIAKLLGVLSLQSLPRRLTLDFRDVFSEGFSFDFLRGDVKVERGIASTNNLQMKGVNAAVLMEGQADIARETQDLKVVVLPEINAGTASLIASVINPAVGLGSFLAQIFLRRPLIESATQQFHIDGSWTDPRVVRVDQGKAANKESKP